MQNKDQRLMHVADRMYDLCSELAELLPKIAAIPNPRAVLLDFAKRGKYWSTKYDDEMSTDDPRPEVGPSLGAGAPAPLGEDLVKAVANMLTEDPNVLVEGLHTAEATYSYEEVPVDPARDILAHVEYTYGIDVSGGYARATAYNPAESPEVDIELLDVKIIAAAGEDGEDIQPSSPEEAKAWRDNAIRFFETRLYDSVKSEAYEKMQDRGDDSDIQYERMRDYQDARLMSSPGAWRE